MISDVARKPIGVVASGSSFIRQLAQLSKVDFNVRTSDIALCRILQSPIGCH